VRRYDEELNHGKLRPSQRRQARNMRLAQAGGQHNGQYHGDAIGMAAAVVTRNRRFSAPSEADSDMEAGSCSRGSVDTDEMGMKRSRSRTDLVASALALYTGLDVATRVTPPPSPPRSFPSKDSIVSVESQPPPGLAAGAFSDAYNSYTKPWGEEVLTLGAPNDDELVNVETELRISTANIKGMQGDLEPKSLKEHELLLKSCAAKAHEPFNPNQVGEWV